MPFLGAGEPRGSDRGEEDTGLGTAAYPAVGVPRATSHPAPTPAGTFVDPGASFLSSCCRVSHSTRLSFQMEMCDQVGRLPPPFPCSHRPGLGPVVAGPATLWDFLVLCRHLRRGRGDGRLQPAAAGCISPTHSCRGPWPPGTCLSVPVTQRGRPCLNRHLAAVICTQWHCRPTADCSYRPGPLSSGIRGPSDCPGLCCAREGGDAGPHVWAGSPDPWARGRPGWECLFR